MELCGTNGPKPNPYEIDVGSIVSLNASMWGVVENSPSRIINIGLYRDLRRQPFESRNLDLLRFLAPHLERAFRLHVQLSELKARADNLQHAVDMLATGVIFLGNSGRIIHMNQAAAKILAERWADGCAATATR